MESDHVIIYVHGLRSYRIWLHLDYVQFKLQFDVIKTYYLLTKPGIIVGNLITAVAGFVLATKGQFDLALFCACVVGSGLVIASACVFNNYIDRNVDQKMERTKNRALARGIISGKKALWFANALGILGICCLAYFTNKTAVLVAFTGWFIYVALYSFWKTRVSLATFVGSLAGATPPVIGYVAAGGAIDKGAVLLFGLLVLWQMPHFFSIALYRLSDYSAAAIPVLPVKKGSQTTKTHMVLYIIGFLVTALLMHQSGYTKSIFLYLIIPITLAWAFLCVKGFYTKNEIHWAQKMFRLSLYVITLLSLALILFKK